MTATFKKETEYTGIPNWWRSTYELGWNSMNNEVKRLKELYPSAWVHSFEISNGSWLYGIRILFNDEADETLFILRESE